MFSLKSNINTRKRLQSFYITFSCLLALSCSTAVAETAENQTAQSASSSFDNPIIKYDTQDPTHQVGDTLYRYSTHDEAGFPESLAYATSSSVTGPWKDQGIIMQPLPNTTTIHPAVFDFNGQTYSQDFKEIAFSKQFRCRYSRA